MSIDTPLLKGPHVTLRPMTRTDAPALVAAAQDGELWNLKVTVVPSQKTIDAYIATALDGQAAGTVMPYVIVINQDSRVIGSTRFWKIDRLNRNLEIGHTWLSESWQRTFVNTECKYLLLRHALDEMKCIRVQFTTDELNATSRAAILRIGAKEEGVIRNERIMPDGRFRNSVRFSIIDSEWPDVRKNLETLMKRHLEQKDAKVTKSAH